MTFDPYRPFDLWDILVNEIVGGVNLFTLLSSIVLIIFCLKRKLGYKVTIVLTIIWLMLVVAKTLNYTILSFILLGVGVFFYTFGKRIVGD